MAPLGMRRGTISGEDGFTFAELLVTMTVLALVAVPLLALLGNGYCYTVRAGRRTVAVNLCRERLEELRAAGYRGCLALLEGGSERREIPAEEDPLPGGYAPYRRATVLERRSAVLAPGSEAGYLRIRVTVTYGTGAGEERVVLETNLGGG